MTDASIAAAYDARAAEYIELLGSVDEMDADRQLIDTWRDSSHGVLLDAGCGPGHWTRFLHDGGREAVGVDLSSELVDAARTRFPDLDLTRASLHDLPFEDASFGGILAWYSLIHTPPAELPSILAELARVLAPGGSVLVGFFDGAPREPFAHAVTTAYFWDAAALSALLQDAGFAVISSERRERAVGEASVRPHGALIARRA
ncbi:class I SAM-dependent methyltransferase [Microbacterium sp. GXF0217]